MKKILLVCLMSLVGFTTMANESWKVKEIVVDGETVVTILAYLGSGTDIEVPKFIKNKKVYSITKLIDPDNGSTINNDAVTSLDFGKANYLKVIEDDACHKLSGLTSNIILPKNLIKIGARAFESTKFNGPVILNNKVKRLEDGVFGFTSGITLLVIPADIEYIGDNLLWHSNIPKIESKILDPSQLVNPVDPNAPFVIPGPEGPMGYAFNPFLGIFNNDNLPEKDKRYSELIVPKGTLQAYQNHTQWGNTPWGKSFDPISEAVATSNIEKEIVCNVYVSNKQLNITSDKQLRKVSIFNILGTSLKEVSSNTTQEIISMNYEGIILVKVVFANGEQKTFKVLSK
ncbi:leucine-rich repeat protein [Prolixibacteraceae bacterium]|nr:leucine-rich repeat protein [Prolixibacteraceae bacterium]